ncbi:MAG: VLRF1 family aeRF1-type release factor [Solirubrobacterales bacterium]
MQHPDRDAIEQLTQWSAPHGVLSLYVEVTPGDRGDGWRAAARNALRGVEDAAQGEGPRERTQAVQHTAERIRQRLASETTPPGRGLIAFAEVSDTASREAWFSSQMTLPLSIAVLEKRPYLRPMIELIDDGGPLGVAALSAEHARIWEWGLGGVEEVVHWNWDVDADDWRERRGPRQRNPAQAQVPSSSGRDLHDKRVKVQREKFLQNIGGHAAEHLQRYAWRELLCFGAEAHQEAFLEGLGDTLPTRCVSHGVIIGEEAHEIDERVRDVLPGLNRDREDELVGHAIDATLSGGGAGALGAQETFDALVEGRVRHLLFDSSLRLSGAWQDARLVIGSTEGEAEPHPTERMIELALQSSAAVTPVEGGAAERLREHGGVGAILRY